ncbi:hypothetical protein [Yersinia enterocolitica]|uniref:hypothetical protein n=1 Tax=Yersinia enterocolitica TaxID=630 RepID=UPI003BA6325B
MSDGLREKLKKLRLGKTENNGVKPFVQAYQSLGLQKETELADLMAASRPETFDKLFYGFSKGDFRASSASKYFASSYWVLVFQQR